MAAELALMIPLAPFIMVIAVVAIVHHYKLEKLRLESSRRGREDLVEKMDALRSDYEQFILGFDARLKRIEGRLSRVEDRVQQAIAPPTETGRPTAQETEAVPIRRIET